MPLRDAGRYPGLMSDGADSQASEQRKNARFGLGVAAVLFGVPLLAVLGFITYAAVSGGQ